MSHAKQWLNKLLYKQNADLIEYVLLLSVLICAAVATGSALTRQINNEFILLTRGF